MVKRKIIWIQKIGMLACLYFVLSNCYCQILPVTSSTHQLYINYIDKDSAFDPSVLQLQTSFNSQTLCLNYINQLPALLNVKGYPAASVDSIWNIDSSSTHIILFVGKQYHWANIGTDSIDKKALDEAGFRDKQFMGKPFNIIQLQKFQNKLLTYYEKTGYPFAEVYLDSVQINQGQMEALLKVNKGQLYLIDSIRVFGKAKISNNFLQKYLDIPNGSVFNKSKIEQLSKKLQELPYLQEIQPNSITMLGNGSILDLYLSPKRSSQINFLIGFLPANSQTGKAQFTGDVNLNLKNALSFGESILLNWQQLQIKSPRLNVGYQQPYIFNSAFGIDFAFDLFKKDSTFLQLNAQLGLQYILSSYQSGKVFVQWQNSFLLADAVDTNQVIATKTLPANSDIRGANVGLDYEWNKTNYRLNPRRGNEIKITTLVGIKNIKKNNDILGIKNPSFNFPSLYDSIHLKSYQLRIKVGVAHYIPIAKQATLKLSSNVGLFSSQTIFRNELFQIGGYKLLRGFDEESIYATQYAAATAEYRYLIAQNSYLFGFADAGYTKLHYQKVNIANQFISGGVGIFFETKFGLLNISYAIGKRNDIVFNIREASKIHFGYTNYF
jgi:outer membrane protein assembly factor BamA